MGAVQSRPEDAYDASPFVPDDGGLPRLRTAAGACRGCPLHEDATGVVFGAGPAKAKLMLVGEQPGDVEDQRGSPFVGPAGRVLRACLEAAEIDVADVYLTNAVKHFKFSREGKRRIHRRPNAAEIDACHPWLEAELGRVRPQRIVALGAVAARSLLGRPTPIEANLGVALSREGSDTPVWITYHPSAALRRQEEGERVRAAIVETLVAIR